MQDYIAEHLESSVDDSALRNSENETVRTRGPHIFRTAYNAYYNMQRTRQDQIIVLRYVVASLTLVCADEQRCNWFWQIRNQTISYQSHF